ncbi:MAG: enolase C-terminal domain-like protein [Pseudomonadota bacterium]
MNVGLISAVTTKEASVTPKTTWRFVRVTTTTGFEGVGEFTHQPAPPDVAHKMHEIGKTLVGTAANRNALSPLSHLKYQGFTPATLYSALEQALADIEAQVAGLPLAHHLGGNPCAPIPLYANINRRTTDRSPEGFSQSARLAVAAGFTSIKIAPFDGLSPELCGAEAGQERLAQGLARIVAVADAARDARVMVDCHWRLTEDAAHALLPALADAGVVWLECPLPETTKNLPALVRLRRLGNDRGIRLAGLETMSGWEAFKPFVEAGAYDVIMPDIKHCGGHQAMTEIAERAAASGVTTSPHNPSGPVAHAHSLHAQAGLPGNEPLEVQFDETPMFDALTLPPPPRRNGTSPLPGGLGLGLSLKGPVLSTER